MSGELIQGALVWFSGFAMGAGIAWWGCRQGLKDALERTGPEPGYREPAEVAEPEKPARVLCKGCRHLKKDWPKEDYCAASPVGEVSPVTGKHEEFSLARAVNMNFDCKKKASR